MPDVSGWAGCRASQGGDAVASASLASAADGPPGRGRCRTATSARIGAGAAGVSGRASSVLRQGLASISARDLRPRCRRLAGERPMRVAEEASPAALRAKRSGEMGAPLGALRGPRELSTQLWRRALARTRDPFFAQVRLRWQVEFRRPRARRSPRSRAVADAWRMSVDAGRAGRAAASCVG